MIILQCYFAAESVRIKQQPKRLYCVLFYNFTQHSINFGKQYSKMIVVLGEKYLSVIVIVLNIIVRKAINQKT